MEDLLYANESDEEEDPGKIDADYQDALVLAIRRFDLMRQLGFKVICQIEACRKIVEISDDIPDEITKGKYLLIGLDLHQVLYGVVSNRYREWNKLAQEHEQRRRERSSCIKDR